MPRGVLTTTFAAALAALAVVTPSAVAAPGSVTDTDFAGGTAEGTEVADGSVRLKRGVLEDFAGTTPPSWMATAVTPWPQTPPAPAGSATVVGGNLVVDGARVVDDPAGPAPRVLEFRAKFGAVGFQHVGFGAATNEDTFNGAPWAMFSTGGGALTPGLYARTRVSEPPPSPPSPTADMPITGVNPELPHTYRIEWTASSVVYSVDGTVRHTEPATFAQQMRPAISDYNAGDSFQVTVESMVRDRYPGSATFVSRTFDAGGTVTAWGALTAAPGGAGVVLETRTSNTAGGGWTDWAALGAGGAIASPAGRYIQYQATLTSSDPFATPALDSVTIAYTVEDPKPPVVGGGSGGGTGGGGTPSGGGGTPSGGGATTPVATSVAVGLVSRSIRASRGGVVKLQVKCLRGEKRCTVSVRLKRGGSVVATKTARIDAGATKTISLRLNKRTRNALASKGSVKLSATMAARDSAGNSKTITRSLTVKAPR